MSFSLLHVVQHYRSYVGFGSFIIFDDRFSCSNVCGSGQKEMLKFWHMSSTYLNWKLKRNMVRNRQDMCAFESTESYCTYLLDCQKCNIYVIDCVLRLLHTYYIPTCVLVSSILTVTFSLNLSICYTTIVNKLEFKLL